MNEAELVDVALAILAEVSPNPRGWGGGAGRTRPGGAAERRPGVPVFCSPSRRLPGPAQLPLVSGRPAGRCGTKPACTADLGTGEGVSGGEGGLPRLGVHSRV